MPIYEYECEGGHRFTEVRKIANRHDAVCPECGKWGNIKISLSNFRMAAPLTIVTPEHGIVCQKPDGGNIRPYDDVPKEIRDDAITR